MYGYLDIAYFPERSYMAKKDNEPVKKNGRNRDEKEKRPRLHPDTTRSIWAVGLAGVALLLIFAGFGAAGPAGGYIYEGLNYMVGWGYFIIPVALLVVAGILVISEKQKVV